MMEAKFTGYFLAATLVIYGSTTTITKAQAAPTNSVEMVAAPLVTTFSCVQNGNDFVTIARRGDQVTPPVINWKPTLGYYTPKAHCYIVSQELTRIVAENGGKLKNLQLITGTVRNQVVVCAVNKLKSCNSSNMLFSLRTENASNEQGVATLNQFSVLGSRTTVTESFGVNSLRLEDLNRFLGPED